MYGLVSNKQKDIRAAARRCSYAHGSLLLHKASPLCATIPADGTTVVLAFIAFHYGDGDSSSLNSRCFMGNRHDRR